MGLILQVKENNLMSCDCPCKVLQKSFSFLFLIRPHSIIRRVQHNSPLSQEILQPVYGKERQVII